MANQRLPGLRLLIATRPDCLERFEQQIDPPPATILVANLATPVECLEAVCRTLKLKLRIDGTVACNLAEVESHGLLAQKLWETTLGNANLVNLVALSLLEHVAIAYDPKDSTLRVLAGASEDPSIVGLAAEVVQQRVTSRLLVDLQEVFKYASIMGLIFDHELIKRVPGFAESWDTDVHEAVMADLVQYNIDTSTYQFVHVSIVDAIHNTLTKVHDPNYTQQNKNKKCPGRNPQCLFLSPPPRST